ncbi:MAG: HAD-IA family hydrolase [Polyangiaceae bacterium]|nr:HAD-IA family hydrolase [Polyangiaceae bacterium]
MTAPPPPAAVVFDLDGTLVDSLGDIVATTQYALRTEGHATPSPETLATFVGDGARLLLARASGLPPESPEVDALTRTFQERYEAHAVDTTRPMPGALEALEALAALPLAVCTNKPRRATWAVLRALGLAERFHVVVAGDELPWRKPDPRVLVRVATALGLEPGALVMVGDGPQDIECGRAAGARTVGVLGGIAPEARMLAARPDIVLRTLGELPAVVDAWQRAGALR